MCKRTRFDRSSSSRRACFSSNASFLVAIHIENDQVSIEQLGANSSFVNQKPLQRHVRQSVHDGDQLHLLENEYSYTVRIRQSEKNEFSSSHRTTLKRQNTDECERSAKKPAIAADEEDESEENRSAWIARQLAALQANANQSSSSISCSLPTTTTSNPIEKSDPTTEDRWETPADGLEVFTSKGVINSDKVR